MLTEETRTIVNRIECDMRKLLEITGEGYITACVVSGSFSMNTEQKKNGKYAIDIFRNEGRQ